MVGGFNVDTSKRNYDVWYWHGPATNWHAKIPDQLLHHRYYHSTIQIDNLIYFLGGNEYHHTGGTAEVWELKWDYEPGLSGPHSSGPGFCPQWCYWNDVEGLQERPDGICSSRFWQEEVLRIIFKNIFRIL